MSYDLLQHKRVIGKVVDISDPEEFGRVKVMIPDMTDELPFEDLPFYWVETGVKANNQGGVIPELETWVEVEFMGSIYDGKVMATLTSKPATIV